MNIGIPKEIKPQEGRVALLPDACARLIAAGHRVLLQSGAGAASGFADALYAATGVLIMDSAEAVYAQAQMIVKVKEPLAEEWPLLRAHHTLFSFLHLAANPLLEAELKRIGCRYQAFEDVRDRAGGLPLLAPMSAIAGRLAVQIGATLLHGYAGGKGVLLGGIEGLAQGRVTVLGVGVAGSNAIEMAVGVGARVRAFDLLEPRLLQIRERFSEVQTAQPERDVLLESLRDTDLLIGAVLRPGRRTPQVADRAMIAQMTAGSVAVDISVDQGGCLETTHVSGYDDPVYVEEGVLHFAVANIPGAVPRTASMALSKAVLPELERLLQEI